MRRDESSFVLKFITRNVGLSSMKIRVGRSSVRISCSDLSNCLVVFFFKKSILGSWGHTKTSSYMDGNMVLDAYFR